MLEVRLLGCPEVTLDGTQIDVDTRKAIALLAYLAVEGAALRDTLAALLWGDSPSDRARATLRRTLSALRSGVGSDVIVSDRNRIELRDRSAVDVVRFEMEMEATSQHAHDPSDACAACIPHLTRAAGLYRGGFLEGFALRDAPEFEDWTRATDEHLRLRAGDALRRLGLARASEGDFPGAITAVSRWIDLDPLREPAYRLSMLLHAWSGDRAGSIAVYRRCVAILDAELGVAPLEETTELYEAILDEDLPPSPGERRRTEKGTAPAPKGADRLIGRDAELGQLRRSVEIPGPDGRLVVVEGASWMGKTRILEELVAELSVAGVVVSRSFRSEQAIPFGVVTQLLRRLMPMIADRRDHVPVWVLDEAARLDPAVARGAGDGSADSLGELRLLEALFEIVRQAAGAGSLVIAIDDAQWLDSASAGFVSYLSRRLVGLPVSIVLLARSGEGLPPPLEDVIATADRVIRLVPLGPDQIAPLAGDRAEALVAATGGVPLLIAEALDGRSLADDEASIGRYIEQRLRAISDLSRQVLTSASVLTGTFDEVLLREVSGRTEEEIVRAVEDLIVAGLVREMPDGLGMGFALEALQTTVYDAASPVRRRLLHRRAAEALESRPRANQDPRLAGEIAAQLAAGGDPRAAGWCRLAGDLSRQVHANREAMGFYETALALGAEDVAGLHLALGELATADGDYPRALLELRAAAAQAEGDLLGLAEHRLGDVHRLLGKFSLAEEHFRRSEPHHPDPASLYADWALLHHRLGSISEALETAHRAEEIARAEGGERELSRALNILGAVSNDAEAAMRYIDDALELAGDDDLSRMAALNNKAHLLSRIGNDEGARRLVEEAIRIAAKTGRRHREAALQNHLADLHHRSGRTTEAEQALTRAVSIFADIDSGSWEPEVWLLRMW